MNATPAAAVASPPVAVIARFEPVTATLELIDEQGNTLHQVHTGHAAPRQWRGREDEYAWLGPILAVYGYRSWGRLHADQTGPVELAVLPDEVPAPTAPRQPAPAIVTDGSSDTSYGNHLVVVERHDGLYDVHLRWRSSGSRMSALLPEMSTHPAFDPRARHAVPAGDLSRVVTELQVKALGPVQEWLAAEGGPDPDGFLHELHHDGRCETTRPAADVRRAWTWCAVSARRPEVAVEITAYREPGSPAPVVLVEDFDHPQWHGWHAAGSTGDGSRDLTAAMSAEVADWVAWLRRVVREDAPAPLRELAIRVTRGSDGTPQRVQGWYART